MLMINRMFQTIKKTVLGDAASTKKEFSSVSDNRLMKNVTKKVGLLIFS